MIKIFLPLMMVIYTSLFLLEIGIGYFLAVNVLMFFLILYSCYIISGFSLCFFIISSSFLYFFSGHIDIVFFGNQKSLLENSIRLYTYLGVVYIFLLVTLHNIFIKTYNINAVFRDVSERKIIWVKSFLLIFILLHFLYGFFSFGISFNISRADNYAGRGVLLSLFRVFLSIFIIFYFSMLSQFRRNDKWFSIFILITFSLSELVFLGDRRVLLSVILALLFIFGHAGYIKVKHLVYLGVGSISLLFFGFVRNAPIELWVNLLTERGQTAKLFSPMNLEFGAASIVASYHYSDYGISPVMFRIVDALANILPGAVFDQRPITPAQEFAQTYFPALHRIGGTYAYNIVVDATYNLGIVGILAYPALTILFLNFCSKIDKGNIYYYSLAMYLMIFSWRMDMFSILKMFILMFVFVLFINLVFKRKLT